MLSMKTIAGKGFDRFATYQEAREQYGPTFRTEETGNMFQVLGYEECVSVLKDHKRFSSSPLTALKLFGQDPNDPKAQEGYLLLLGAVGPFVPNMMVSTDDPKHARLRSLIAKVFTPRMVDSLTEQIQEFSITFIEDVLKKNEVDVMKDLANVFPIAVIAHLLDVDADRYDDFKRWTNTFVLEPTNMNFGGSSIEDQIAHKEFVEYFEGVFARLRKNPKDSLIGQLVQLEKETDNLNPDELMAMAILLLVAGNETTTNWIGNSFLAFHHHYDQFELLLEKPELLDQALEEVLRYYPPVHSIFRFASESLQFNGEDIKAGEVINVWLAAANRDQAVCDKPDEFDITRTNSKHISFASGIHHCIGAPLSRLETRIFFTELLSRIKGFNITDESKIKLRESLMLFGAEKLVTSFST